MCLFAHAGKSRLKHLGGGGIPVARQRVPLVPAWMDLTERGELKVSRACEKPIFPWNCAAEPVNAFLTGSVFRRSDR